MSELYWMVTIANRAKFPGMVALYQQRGILTSIITLGHGTAPGELLNYLGLGSTERAVCFSVVTGETWRVVKRDLERKIRIDVPGIGVAFITPLSSIGGRRELAFFMEQQNYQKGEESVMRGTAREMLVIISNQGYHDLVMDAARGAGAYGGTVIHARGTGMERAERFLGVSLASEKDVTLIVAKTSQKNHIMGAIMRKAGMESPAKSIVFSLPVTDTAGLRLLEDDSDEENRAASGKAPDGTGGAGTGGTTGGGTTDGGTASTAPADSPPKPDAKL